MYREIYSWLPMHQLTFALVMVSLNFTKGNEAISGHVKTMCQWQFQDPCYSKEAIPSSTFSYFYFLYFIESYSGVKLFLICKIFCKFFNKKKKKEKFKETITNLLIDVGKSPPVSQARTEYSAYSRPLPSNVQFRLQSAF